MLDFRDLRLAFFDEQLQHLLTQILSDVAPQLLQPQQRRFHLLDQGENGFQRVEIVGQVASLAIT